MRCKNCGKKCSCFRASATLSTLPLSRLTYSSFGLLSHKSRRLWKLNGGQLFAKQLLSKNTLMAASDGRFECLRCGYRWRPRMPWPREKHGGQNNNDVPVRCARCRSKYWNKSYVRKISDDLRNPNSPLFTPLLLTDFCFGGGIVRRNEAGQFASISRRKAAHKRLAPTKRK